MAEGEGNGGAAAQVADTRSEVKPDADSLENLTDEAILAKSQRFRNERSRGGPHRDYTPGQVIEELANLDETKKLIGTPFEGVDLRNAGIVTKIHYFIYSHLPGKMKKDGDAVLNDLEQAYQTDRAELKTQIDFIDNRLNDESRGTNGAPNGLYALKEYFAAQKQFASESATEAKELMKEVYARLQETTETLSKTNRKFKDQRANLEMQKRALTKEYKALRDQHIVDKNLYVEAKNDYNTVSSEIDEIEKKQEGLYQKMQKLDEVYHKQQRIDSSEAGKIITEGSLLEAQADETLGVYLTMVAKVNGIEIKKREAVANMSGTTTAKPGSPLAIPSMTREPTPEDRQYEADLEEEMRQVANYERQ